MSGEHSFKVIGLIPARLDSKRLPGKLTKEIQGKSILQLVYEQVAQCQKLDEVYVISGDEKLLDLAKKAGANVIRSTQEFICGTDRCLEAVTQMSDVDVFINIQADQPQINPSIIDHLVEEMIKDADTHIGSLMSVFTCVDRSTNTVKVEVDKESMAQRFFRTLETNQLGHKHIGVYAFKRPVFEKIRNMKPTENEIKYHLEQLRWMDNGLSIKMFSVIDVPTSIDVQEDIDLLKE